MASLHHAVRAVEHPDLLLAVNVVPRLSHELNTKELCTSGMLLNRTTPTAQIDEVLVPRNAQE